MSYETGHPQTGLPSASDAVEGSTEHRLARFGHRHIKCRVRAAGEMLAAVISAYVSALIEFKLVSRVFMVLMGPPTVNGGAC